MLGIAMGDPNAPADSTRFSCCSMFAAAETLYVPSPS